MLNFSAKKAKANTGFNIKKAKVLINNYGSVAKDGFLRPYEAVIYQL
ncbi:hypothetical protein [Flavobacterium undicola]|nr:hypothetical protein [Flavobacterium undicola]MBA0883405.1 hypothetical protein [Flavobacterium undicola]